MFAPGGKHPRVATEGVVRKWVASKTVTPLLSVDISERSNNGFIPLLWRYTSIRLLSYAGTEMKLFHPRKEL